MINVPEIFGSMVFNDAVMRERLPKEVYCNVKRTIENGESLDLSVANAVAGEMKEWAIQKGATHFTHWFQPMTGITAEKHDSFITPTADGSVIMEFSGKELIKGEPDASSFPSGGLRATFEARGYTAWDPTSYAFIKENTLCIPTVFYSYGGEALDKKTPLLRSMRAINQQALRVLKLLGDSETSHIFTVVGAEQEYFLVDKSVYDKRRDLIFTGRTLYGAKPPKGQELEDHYFGSLKPRVRAYMSDLDEELWKLGVLAKTEHNETAPAQHELAPIYTNTNAATDQNQLTMEIMKKVAGKHGMVCLLHEKPFAGVNGSGKHNNWSISTDTGKNLLSPGKKPYENLVFLTFLSAVIAAADKRQDLLRISVATAGNDHRLGASEAPPAIVSIYLGDELTSILEAIRDGAAYHDASSVSLDTLVASLPNLKKDSTDRNRTSPLAFTGNKFEFRMLGSSLSIAGPNIILNTIIAEALDEIAQKLEKAQDVTKAVYAVVADIMKEHGRIVFNGNNYSDEWVREAENRGLLNLKSTPDALEHFATEENIELFDRYKIFSEIEIRSRCELLYENYSKVLHIEALTMIDMARQQIMPAVFEYVKALSDTVVSKRSAVPEAVCESELYLIKKISALTDACGKQIEKLGYAIDGAEKYRGRNDAEAHYYRTCVFPAMAELRASADELEVLVGSRHWPYPNYGELLFSV